MPSKYLKTHKAEYRAWIEMRRRCRATNRASTKHYRNLGITVCERWLVFENFLADMGRRPAEKYSVERKDNTKGYCPENCKWATYAEQNANRTHYCNIIEYEGKKQCLSAWSRETGINRKVIRNRINKGLPVSVALTK